MNHFPLKVFYSLHSVNSTISQLVEGEGKRERKWENREREEEARPQYEKGLSHFFHIYVGEVGTLRWEVPSYT